jgi:hypothetical protein
LLIVICSYNVDNLMFRYLSDTVVVVVDFVKGVFNEEGFVVRVVVEVLVEVVDIRSKDVRDKDVAVEVAATDVPFRRFVQDIEKEQWSKKFPY